MIQVYCNNEDSINKWLKENTHVDVMDIKMSLNDQGDELIMVIYKDEEHESDKTLH